MILHPGVEIETSEPQAHPSARWATLKIGGVEVFTELVYDTDERGHRTEAQARDNLLRLFGGRMRRLLEEQ